MFEVILVGIRCCSSVSVSVELSAPDVNPIMDLSPSLLSESGFQSRQPVD